MTDIQSNFETDTRFPSGEWIGFWLHKTAFEGRQAMSLALSFTRGKLTGEGKDIIGAFTMQGRYDLSTGKVVIHKYYPQHHVLYEGWAEQGKGIWGLWTLPGGKDGFHLWPKSMRDPTSHTRAAVVQQPRREPEPAVLTEDMPATVGKTP